jgi:hypothetical protein|tara:strand:- start:312 stop:542 length:231 start_codon:yes stop_codon:yes gene_type:complete
MNILTTALLAALSGDHAREVISKKPNNFNRVNKKTNYSYDDIKSSSRKSKNNMHNYTKAYYNKDMAHFKRSKRGNH